MLKNDCDNQKNDPSAEILNIIQKSVSVGIEEGVVKAVKKVEEMRDEKRQKQFDTRKYNTELLLKNYRNFKKHISNSVYSSEKVQKLEKEREEYKIDFDEPMDDTYIKSILKSKLTTSLLLEQIDVFLNYYKIKCLNSRREEIRRRGRVIDLLYIAEKDEEGNEFEKRLTFEEIADIMHTSTKTINRDRKEAIKELSVLFFGIEGLKIK